MSRAAPHRRRWPADAILVALLGGVLWLVPPTANAEAPAAPAAAEISAAEQLLLMSDQMANIAPPLTLSYQFRQHGQLASGFEDQVKMHFTRRGTPPSCCAARGEFLSGARQVRLPDVEQAQGNPVTLYFLEHDIRDMHERTRGSVNYFRKRIRMALFNAASLTPVTVRFQGRTLSAQQIRIQPYLDDPNRHRLEPFAHKAYTFTLSDAVPGGVVAIRSHTPAPVPAGNTPQPASSTPSGTLLEEELLLDGATVPPSIPVPTRSSNSPLPQEVS